MRVFLTGATGFIGTAVVRELIGAGHQVLGLARSREAADSLSEMGAEIHYGDLEDWESLRRGVAASDGVIHTGFIHDFSRLKEVCEIDRNVIGVLSTALIGSDRPLVVTSGIALVSPGQIATELDLPRLNADVFPRVATEEAVIESVSMGVRVSVVRLAPSVHGAGDHGFVPALISIAQERGVSAYVGEGTNRWTAVHRRDAATLYRLALEKGTSGSRFHGVAEEGVPFRDIAEAIGRRLNIPVVSKSPEEAAQHFGWLARFAEIDCPASSKLTQEILNWRPEYSTLVSDLNNGGYF